MKKLLIKKPVAGLFGLAMHPGEVGDFNDTQADLLISEGFAIEVDAETGSALPADVPYRKALVEAGVKDLSELKGMSQEDVAAVTGLKAAQIEKLLNWKQK